MMSLFSPFDMNFSLFPVLGYIFFVYMMFNKIQVMSVTNLILEKMKEMSKFLMSLKPKMYSKSSLIVMLGVMTSVLVLNFVSVFSYNFPIPSQFGPLFMFSLCLWFSFIWLNFLMNIKGMLYHFIPEGAPIYLVFVLFMIELTSSFIRPITLTVRLVANILAGHLLLILLSKLVFTFSPITPVYVVLNLVEIFVALIQSYIFCTMISLYFSEIR